MCKICSKLTTKITERRHWRGCSVFIVNFEQILHIILVFPLFTLNMWNTTYVIVDFEHLLSGLVIYLVYQKCIYDCAKRRDIIFAGQCWRWNLD